MSKVVETKFLCPLCKVETLVKFHAPQYFQPAIIPNLICSGCEAGYQVTFSKARGTKLLRNDSEIHSITKKTLPYLEKFKVPVTVDGKPYIPGPETPEPA